jgi:hypothetical protein
MKTAPYFPPLMEAGGGDRGTRPLLSAITEPATMLTDYMLALLALPLAGVLLRAAWGEDSLAAVLWAAGLVAISVAAMLGGTVHGFARQLGHHRRGLWRATTFLLALAADLLVVAAAVAHMDPEAAAWLAAAMVLKLVVFALWMRTREHFRFVVIDQSISLAALLALQLLVAPGARSAPWIVAAVLVCFAAGLVQRSELAVWRLNQNDLSHLVQLVGVYLLFRGGSLLVSR